MKAITMFKKSGYKCLVEEDKICYKKEENIYSSETKKEEKITFEIDFCLKYEFIDVYNYDENYNYNETSFDIDMNLFKAIKKQVEELGWK